MTEDFKDEETMQENEVPQKVAEDGADVFDEAADREFLEGFADGDVTPKSSKDKSTDKAEDKEDDAFDESDKPDSGNDDDDDELIDDDADCSSMDDPDDVKQSQFGTEPLKVQFLGKSLEIKPEEVPVLVQKGLNHDRMEEKLKAYESGGKELEEINDIAAYYDINQLEAVQLAIENFKRMETIRLQQQQGIPQDQALALFQKKVADARANQPKPNGGRDTTAEIESFLKTRPDLAGLKSFPSEVAMDFHKGLDLKTAYLKYENNQLAQAAAQAQARYQQLQETSKRQKQQQKSTKAPASQKGTGAGVRRSDPFMAGFDEDDQI